MRPIRSVLLGLAMVVFGVGISHAQQPYPPQFSNGWMNSCISSCQNNELYKARQGICPAYCTCVVQESEASIPLEVAMQADRDMAAKNNQSEAVQRVSKVTHQCQSRFAVQQQPPQRRARQ